MNKLCVLEVNGIDYKIPEEIVKSYIQFKQERDKYKAIIEKATGFIENGDLLYLASKCSIIYKNNIEVVAIYDRLKELLKTLKELEEGVDNGK